MKKKTEIPKYNDGFVTLYRVKNETSSFGAKLNPEKLSDMEYAAELAYEEMSRRDQDYEFAEMNSRQLSMKIKTPNIPGVDKNMMVCRNGMLYNIIKLDTDIHKNVMYLYLEEDRKIADGNEGALGEAAGR